MGLIGLAAGTARRIGEIGFIIGAIGGLLFIAGAAFRANSARESTSRNVLMAAGILHNHRLHSRHRRFPLGPLTRGSVVPSEVLDHLAPAPVAGVEHVTGVGSDQVVVDVVVVSQYHDCVCPG